MHTTQVGDIAEMMVAAELVRRGYFVSRPLTNGAPYDLLVDIDGKILRIQVKSASYTKTGCIRVRLTSSKYHRGRKQESYDGKVDYVIGVVRETADFFVVEKKELKMTELSIRTSETKNGQKTRIRLADAYQLNKHFPGREVVVGAGFEPATPSV